MGISCPASASGVLIDDLPIDPWGELGEILGNGQIEETSLNDDIATRSIKFPSGYLTGFSVPAWYFGDISTSFNYVDGQHVILRTGSVNAFNSEVSLSVNLGFYIDVYTSVLLTYTSDQYLIINSADNLFRFTGIDSSCFVVPDEVQLLINGQPAQYSNGEYYDTYSVSTDGTFSISGFSYPLSSSVISVGFRFLYTRDHTATVSLSESIQKYGIGIVFTDNSVLTVADTPATPDPDPGPDNPGGDTEEDEQKGLLKSILSAIANIGQTILNGIKGLFVPDEEDITEIKEKYQTLLEERLGFVYEGYTLLADGFNTIRDSMGDGEEYTFHFPGVKLPYQGERLTIIEEQDVDLDNDVFQVLRPVLGTIVSLIAVVGVVKVSFRLVSAIISGVGYFQFQSSRDEEEDP